jgi:hypothetical protein
VLLAPRSVQCELCCCAHILTPPPLAALPHLAAEPLVVSTPIHSLLPRKVRILRFCADEEGTTRHTPGLSGAAKFGNHYEPCKQTTTHC